jgi:N6-adenosine-specific RNA methylase IME4
LPQGKLQFDMRRNASSVLNAIQYKPPKVQFKVLYADPAWAYTFRPRKHGLPYPSMPTEQLCAMGGWVRSLCAKDCVIYMWATSPKLADALLVMEAWGFTLKTTMVWDKERPYIGYYHNSQHELLLIGGRGRSAPKIARKAVIAVESVLRERKTAHSRKPEMVYEIIETLYPTLLKLELFARLPKVRRRWRYWGNQAGTRQVLKSAAVLGEWRGLVGRQRFGQLVKLTFASDGKRYADPRIS